MSITLTPAASAQQIIRRVARRRRSTLLVVAILVVIAAITSIGVGAVAISPGRVVNALLGHGTYGDHLIVTQFRLPRVLVGLCVGASLAVSGVILQAVTRNPLAEPSIVGINGGAGLGAILVLSFVHGALASWLVPTAAFAGAALAGGSTYLLARRAGIVNPGRLALMGVAFGGLALALIQLVIVYTVFTGDIQVALQWLTGSLWDRSWTNILQVAPFTLLLLPLTLLLSD